MCAHTYVKAALWRSKDSLWEFFSHYSMCYLEIKLWLPGFAANTYTTELSWWPQGAAFFFFFNFCFFSSKVRHCFKGIVSLNDCSWGFSWLTTACPWGTDGLSWVRLGSAGPPILSRCLHFGLLTLNPFWGDKGPAWRQHWLCSELSLLWGKSNHVLRLRGPPSQNPTSLFTKVPSWSYHIYIPPMYYFIHTKE